MLRFKGKNLFIFPCDPYPAQWTEVDTGGSLQKSLGTIILKGAKILEQSRHQYKYRKLFSEAVLKITCKRTNIPGIVDFIDRDQYAQVFLLQLFKYDVQICLDVTVFLFRFRGNGYSLYGYLQFKVRIFTFSLFRYPCRQLIEHISLRVKIYVDPSLLFLDNMRNGSHQNSLSGSPCANQKKDMRGRAVGGKRVNDPALFGKSRDH